MEYSVHQTVENKLYKHGIQIHGSMLDFHDVRKWMCQTYGHGDSIDQDVNVKYNKHWAFYVKFRHHMIYVRGDEELAWFMLKYGVQK